MVAFFVGKDVKRNTDYTDEADYTDFINSTHAAMSAPLREKI